MKNSLLDLRKFIVLIITFLVIISSEIFAQLEVVKTLNETHHNIFFADYSRDGRYIVTTGSDFNIIIWNTETGTIYRTLAGLKKRTNAAVFSSDGNTLVTAGEDNLITLWNPNTISVIGKLEGHLAPIKAIDISMDDKMLVSGSEDRSIRIWDLENLILQKKLTGHRKVINSVRFSHDGMHIVSGSADKTIRIWEVSTGKELHSIIAHDGWVRCVAYSPDDKLIASAGDDNMIYLWNASNMEQVAQLAGHTDWVQTLDFSPGGKYLVSGGHDQIIILWDVQEKRMIESTDKLGHIILTTKFSPDSREILSNELLSEQLSIWKGNFVDPPSTLARETETTSGTTEQGVKQPIEEPAKEEPVQQQATIAAAVVSPVIKETPVSAIIYPQIILYSPVLSAGRAITEQGTSVIIGRISDPDGINVLLLNKVPAEISEAGVFEIPVELKKGENKFELVAINNTGKLNRQAFSIDCTAETTMDSKAAIPEIYSGNYHALIIAVNEYDDPNILDLDNPIRDAENLREVLVSKYIFDPEHIYFLKNPTRMEIIMALDELSRTITEKDNLLIFYAGHGHWDEKGSIGYWLPRDAMNSNTANWFRNSTMRDFIGSIKSKHTILIADACFSGSIFKTRNAFAEPPGGINKLYELTSRKAMTSGTLEIVPDESIFLKYLIKRLEENGQRFLSSEELFSSLKTAVLNNSPNVPQYGTIQNVGDEGGDFIFILQ